MLPSDLTGDTPGQAYDRRLAFESVEYRGHKIVAMTHGATGYRCNAGITVYGGFTWSAAPGATWTHTVDEAKALIDLWEEVQAEGEDKGALHFLARNSARSHDSKSGRAWLLERLYETVTLLDVAGAGGPQHRRLSRALAAIKSCIKAYDKEHAPLGEAEAFSVKQLAGGESQIRKTVDGAINLARSGLEIVNGKYVVVPGFVETTA